MKKKYASHLELQTKFLEGARKLTEIVSSTLGPRGNNVLIHKKDKNPITTKDGVTIAKQIELEDLIENAGAHVIRQASSQTEKTSGDGTTTSTVLAYSILKQAQKYLVAGSAPIELVRGIEKAVEKVVEDLKNHARPIKNKQDIAHIATISANGDKQMGELIATAVDNAGKDGAIVVEESRSLHTVLDLVEGFRIDSGYISPYFINDERRNIVHYEKPLILVTDAKIDSVKEIYPILEIVAQENRPFVIIAEDVIDQALAALIMNVVRNVNPLKIAAVKAPRYGTERRNIMQDLALSIGAKFIDKTMGCKLENVKLVDLGTAKSIDIEKGMTTIVGGMGESKQIETRIEILKEEIKQTSDLQECERIQERITRLSSGVAVIRVGGATEIEVMEKKYRIDDALEAVKSSQEEGILPGGGVALLRASKTLQVKVDNEDQKFGVEIIKRAIKEPLQCIVKNAGKSHDVIQEKVEHKRKYEMGYDAVSDRIVNMNEAGIIDPAKVIRCSLQNAASVACALISTKFVIIEE